jgi:hypothetical protein
LLLVVEVLVRIVAAIPEVAAVRVDCLLVMQALRQALLTL